MVGGFLKYSLRAVRRRLGMRPAKGTMVERVMGVYCEYDPATAVGHQLYYRAAFERQEIDFCEKLLSEIPDPVFLDVGANIGVHSLCWATRNVSLRGQLFEPAKATAELLRRNITRNGLSDRLKVHELALSSRSGEASFFECSDNAFSSLKDTHRMEVVAQTRVPVVTLDEWASSNNLNSVDLIKIDVEGLEHDVVLGAQSVLKAYRPHLFVEIFGGQYSNPNPSATIELIRGLGYEAYTFDRVAGPVAYTEHSDDRYNYYFRPL